MDEKEKCKNRVVKRILNHALGIIYLMTGEEYIVVKKNSPHSSSHLLTGEVPITFGDVSVYFSMEEWDYIEEHKDIYKDFIKQNQQEKNIPKSPDNSSLGHLNGKRDIESHNETEHEMDEKDIEKVEIDSYICESLHDESHDTMAREEGEWERKEMAIQEMENYSDIHSRDMNKMDLRIGQIEAPCVNVYVKVEEPEMLVGTNTVHSFPADGSMSRNVLEESHAVGSSADGIVEHDAGVCQCFRGEDSEVSVPGELISYEMGNVPSTLSLECEQPKCDPDEKFVSGSSNLAWKMMQMRKKNSINWAKCFNRKPSYADHQTQWTGKPHKCSECGKNFVYKSHLLIHQKKHTGEKPHMCDDCGKPFDYKNHLLIHQRTHMGEMPHKCNDCGKLFAYKCHLDKHQSRIVGEESHRCDKCEKQFTYKSCLVEHQRTHTDPVSFPCNECGREFTFKSRLLDHQRTHTGEKPHGCNECGKHLTSQASLTKHLRTHTGEKPHLCKECGKQFGYKSGLVRHMRTHTGEKPHRCDECGKQFAAKAMLVIHQRRHTGEKPYNCDQCGKNFSSKTSFIEHQRIHTGEKPHVCSYCGKCFTQRSTLFKHKKIHTGEKVRTRLRSRYKLLEDGRVIDLRYTSLENGKFPV